MGRIVWLGLLLCLRAGASDCSDLLFLRSYTLNPLLDPGQQSEKVLPNLSKTLPHHYVLALNAVERSLQVRLKEILERPEVTFESVITPIDAQLAQIDLVLGFWTWQAKSNRTQSLLKMEKIVERRRIRVSNRIFTNRAIFAKVLVLYESRETLDKDQKRLVERYYDQFVENGLNLTPDKMARLNQLKFELSELGIRFRTNVVQSRSQFEHWVMTADELKGLPAKTLEEMQSAAARFHRDGYLLTLQPAVYRDVMDYCQNPEIRKIMYTAMRRLAAQGDAYDNSDVLQQIVQRRTDQARILGYPTYADWVLRRRMVGSLPNLRRFYQDLIAQVRPPAAIEEQEFQAFVKQKTGTETIQPWDRNYYERLFVEESLQLDHQKIKEYFTLDRSLGVLFALIHRLYGLTFIERTDLPKLHSDVVTYEVRRNGQTRSFVYFDPYSRSALKTSGAWMSTLATLSPSVISVNMNLQKPSPGEATLMSPDNVVTLFHEFGHGLHGILSQVRYHSQFGTRVLRDAVELPSQFMENYVFVPSVLGELAHHYKTGEALPPEELAKIIRDREFRVATQDLRQIRYGILDLAWHSGEVPKLGESLEDFESRVLYDVIVNEDAKAVLISPSFSHIFDGGYAAGYYSYKWADHFEKKAFAKFEREGLFNPDTAQRFEKYFLSVGDSMDPQEAFDLFIDESEAR